jgi:hypothetical protein
LTFSESRRDRQDRDIEQDRPVLDTVEIVIDALTLFKTSNAF